MSDDCGPDMCCADDGVCDAVDYGGDDGYVGGDDLTRNRVPTAIDYHRQCKEIQEEIAQIEQDNDTLLEIFAQARDGCNKNTRKRFSALMERTNNNLAAKKKQKAHALAKIAEIESEERCSRIAFAIVVTAFVLFLLFSGTFKAFYIPLAKHK